jgi:riboflavin-specific deaminase-like protein
MTRPYVLLSVAVSLDGYIDDTTPERLLLSNAADFDRVDEVRASVDAILIGAGTMRADNPRLLVNSEKRRAERIRLGLPEYPLKVSITRSGDLSRDLKFWHHGGGKVVYTCDKGYDGLAKELDGLADVVSLGASDVPLERVLDDLASRGIQKIMVEGGTQIHTDFLARDLADELHFALAPILVGQPTAPRFVNEGVFKTGRMRLIDVQQIGDVALMRYRLRRSS